MREQTICISVHNGINYLPLVVKSVRENSYDKDCPFVIYSENSDDGTNETLSVTNSTSCFVIEVGAYCMFDLPS